ncbi:MAG: hypothetical protein PPP58_06265 [Natronomonas sp.]
MDAGQKSALLWGGVGAMVFLVGHQSYLLLGGRFLGVGPVATTAVGVFVAAAAAALVVGPRLRQFGRQRGPRSESAPKPRLGEESERSRGGGENGREEFKKR